MPSLWRIARRPYALDKVGAGARDTGGRWNAVGTAVIYAGRTIGIAALEKLVHLSGVVPPDLALARAVRPVGDHSRGVDRRPQPESPGVRRGPYQRGTRVPLRPADVRAAHALMHERRLPQEVVVI